MEGIASHTGPESCACGCEAASEALIGECVRPGIVRQFRGADVFRPTEGEVVRVVIAFSLTLLFGQKESPSCEAGAVVADSRPGGRPAGTRIGDRSLAPNPNGGNKDRNDLEAEARGNRGFHQAVRKASCPGPFRSGARRSNHADIRRVGATVRHCALRRHVPAVD